MIAVIRIKGKIGIKKPINETLDRLKIRKKYACVILTKPSKVELGMLKKVIDFVAYGEIDDATLKELIEKRGKMINKKKKINSDEIIKELKAGKKFEEVNLKPFFRLHPPRGGIESKKHFGVGKGVLGNNKNEINELIRKML